MLRHEYRKIATDSIPDDTLQVVQWMLVFFERTSSGAGEIHVIWDVDPIVAPILVAAGSDLAVCGEQVILTVAHVPHRLGKVEPGVIPPPWKVFR
jgi:hypothetical protein